MINLIDIALILTVLLLMEQDAINTFIYFTNDCKISNHRKSIAHVMWVLELPPIFYLMYTTNIFYTK